MKGSVKEAVQKEFGTGTGFRGAKGGARGGHRGLTSGPGKSGVHGAARGNPKGSHRGRGRFDPACRGGRGGIHYHCGGKRGW